MMSIWSTLSVLAMLKAFTAVGSTTPLTLPFDASTVVTNKNEIRVAVEKKTDTPIRITLQDKSHGVIYQKTIKKHQSTFIVRLNVSELEDGQYELEIYSCQGSIKKQIQLATQPAEQISRQVAMQ